MENGAMVISLQSHENHRGSTPAPVRNPMRSLAAWGFFLAVGALPGCAMFGADKDGEEADSSVDLEASPAISARTEASPPAVPPVLETPGPRPPGGFVELGTGEFVDLSLRMEEEPSAEGAVTLNFEDTPLAEVVKAILGDLLGHNYLVDPSVRGTVSLETVRPVARENLVPTLEMLLRMNGAAVVLNRGVYHVVPRSRASRGLLIPQLGDTAAPLPQGYALRVVPLRFVSAAEMAKILEPFAPPDSVIRVDSGRNLLLFAGSVDELASLGETVRIFDVDWLEGMSFGLFVPEFVEASTLAGELGHIFGGDGQSPLSGLVKIVPIERLDALLVVSPRPEYLRRAEEWVERLDRDSGTTGQRLFVYRVENGKAADLAAVLNQVFQPREGGREPPKAQLAPGLEPVDIRSDTAAGEEAPVSGTAEGLLIGVGPEIRIIADEANNSLLVMATGQQYRQVLRALKSLDISPLQVLIEATIAEISLTGDLSLGLEWFLKHRLGNRPGEVQLDLGAAGLAPAVGFSYVLRSASEIRLVLNALASDSRLNVVSSPSLMVLNNQQASIQVGDQVPVTTQQQQATSTTSTVVNNVEFRDTGVLLTVTPRVNAGGLVVLELEQEVSDVAPGSAGSLTPTIQQRKIDSTVAVQSGETVVLGGLIRENENRSRTGVPLLSRIPLLGWLFGTTTDSTRRTELVVLITPRAVQGAESARRITEEFRSKMESLKPFYDRSEPTPDPAPPEPPGGH